MKRGSLEYAQGGIHIEHWLYVRHFALGREYHSHTALSSCSRGTWILQSMVKLAGFCCKGKYFQAYRQIISITTSKTWGRSLIKQTRVHLNGWVWQSSNKTLLAWTNDRSDVAEATICHLPLDIYKWKSGMGQKESFYHSSYRWIFIFFSFHFLLQNKKVLVKSTFQGSRFCLVLGR